MEEDPSAPARSKETSNPEVTSLDSKRPAKFLLNSMPTVTDQLVSANSLLRLHQRAQPEEDESEIIVPIII